MEILDNQGLAAVCRAARQFTGPVASLDHAGLVALGGGLGQARATLIRAGGDGPVLVVIQQRPGRPWDAFAGLSVRERQVAALVSRGRTNAQIGQELWISVATVKDHVHHILRKTGLPNRAAVAGRWRSGHGF